MLFYFQTHELWIIHGRPGLKERGRDGPLYLVKGTGWCRILLDRIGTGHITVRDGDNRGTRCRASSTNHVLDGPTRVLRVVLLRIF